MGLVRTNECYRREDAQKAQNFVEVALLNLQKSALPNCFSLSSTSVEERVGERRRVEIVRRLDQCPSPRVARRGIGNPEYFQQAAWKSALL